MNTKLEEIVRQAKAYFESYSLVDLAVVRMSRVTWEELCALEDPSQGTFRPWDRSALVYGVLVEIVE